MTSLPSVLLIDDEKSFRNFFCECLKEEVKQDLIQIETAGDAREGLQIIEHHQEKGIPIYVFIDIILPGMSGLELISEINSRSIHPKASVISAHKKLSELEEIKNKYDWVDDCFRKPLSKYIIKQKIKDFLNISDITKFDYSSFDQEISSLLLEETEKIKSILKRTVDNIIDIGGSLYKIKSKLDYGQFLLWVEKELPLDYTTANNFMRVYSVFRTRREEISQMGLSISVLYLLSLGTTPNEFREEVFRRAKAGNSISFVETKRLRQEFLQNSKKNQKRKSDNKENTITIDVTSSPTEDVSDAKPIITKISPNQKPSTIKAQSQEIIKVVPKQNVWHLGKHILYCGLPNNPEFKDLLKSSSICLNIGFPDFSDWTPEKLFPIQARSTLVYSNLNFDPDEQLETLSTMLESSIELSTREKDKILFAFFPHPEILLLIDELLCTSIIAEPDPKKCEAIISLWKQYKS